MSKLRLVYLSLEGGRGGAIRAALIHANEPFEDKFVPFRGQKAFAADYKIPPVGLPWLIVEGRAVTQSSAILRFAGKKSDLYPQDHFEALIVDEVLDIVQDVLTKTPQEPNEAVKKAKRDMYQNGKMKEFFDLLEVRASAVPGDFVLGSTITIADLSVYYLLELIRCGEFDYVEPSYPDAWPALMALEKAVEESPVLKRYRTVFASQVKG